MCPAGSQTAVKAGESCSSPSAQSALAGEDKLDNLEAVETELPNSHVSSSSEIPVSRAAGGAATSEGLTAFLGAPDCLPPEVDSGDKGELIEKREEPVEVSAIDPPGEVSMRTWSVVARMPPPPGIAALALGEERDAGVDAGSCEKDRLEALCAKANGLSCCLGMEEEIRVSPRLQSLSLQE